MSRATRTDRSASWKAMAGGAAQAVALLVLEPARHADAVALRHVHEVAAGDRELHRQARALRLQRILDRLDEDLLPRLQQLGDPLALAPAPAAPAAGHLDAREHHVVGVQEAVLLPPDVDERRLEPGQDVVDLALVDVSDDGPRSAALDVELADAPVVACFLLAAALATCGGGPLRLQDRDSRFATVDRDEQLLS